MGEPAPKVSLREITADSMRAIVDLSISDSQEGFVADNVYSIAQAHFSPEAWFRAIYADEAPVGFVMLALEPEKPRYYLWRFMIDRQHQGHGYGKAAMELIIEFVRTQPDAKELFLDVIDRSDSAHGFYEALGFVATGELAEDEIVMRLEL